MRLFGHAQPDLPGLSEAPAGGPYGPGDGLSSAASAPVPSPRPEAKYYKSPYINERKKYELIIAASGQVVYDYDLANGEIAWSGNLEQVMGYLPEEMGGIEKWAERIHPEDRGEAVRLLEICEKNREVYEIDYRFRNRNGGYRWFHDRGFFLIEEDRNLRRMIGMMNDIHERKQAELLQSAVYKIAQAADTSAGLDDLFKSVHAIIGTVMPAGNFYIALYDRAAELLEFPYFRDEEDPPPGPTKPGKGLTEHVIRTGRPLLCDEATDRDLRGRGEVALVGAPSAIWLGVPLIVDGVTLGAMVVQHYDDPAAYGPAELRMLEYVSSQVARSIWRKDAEETLRRNEQRLSHHIQQTPLAVIEWDQEFKVRQWNRAAERIFGYTAAEAIGRHASFIVPESDRDQVDRVRDGLMNNTAGERSTNENVTKDGRTITCEWYNTPLVDADGRVTGVASLAQDVTERRRTEAALRDSEELYRRLVSAVPDMIVRTDLEGNIIFANDIALRRSGSARVEDLVGATSSPSSSRRSASGPSPPRRGCSTRRSDPRRWAWSSRAGRASGSKWKAPSSAVRAASPTASSTCAGTSPSASWPRRASARAWSSCGRP